MTTPDQQDRVGTRGSTGVLAGRGTARWRRSRAVSVAALAALLLSVGAAQAVAAPGAEGAPDDSRAPGTSASVAEWRDWSEDLFAEARSTDWAADSAARGCELISVDIVGTTVPEGALSGSPDGLELPVVERVEDCTSGAPGTAGASAAPNSDFAAAATCRSTSGPGTVCLTRSGSYLTASFTYRGSGSIEGFIRIYERSSSSGCGTGSTQATSSVRSYSNGTTRSVSSYQPSYDHYSASFWEDVWWGSDNLGTVCRSI